MYTGDSGGSLDGADAEYVDDSGGDLSGVGG